MPFWLKHFVCPSVLQVPFRWGMEGSLAAYVPIQSLSTVGKLAERHQTCLTLLLLLAATFLFYGLAAWSAGYTTAKSRCISIRRGWCASPSVVVAEGPVAPDGQSPTRW
jgi:hypothetical protein